MYVLRRLFCVQRAQSTVLQTLSKFSQYRRASAERFLSCRRLANERVAKLPEMFDKLEQILDYHELRLSESKTHYILIPFCDAQATSRDIMINGGTFRRITRVLNIWLDRLILVTKARIIGLA